MRRFIDIVSGTQPQKASSPNLLALLEAKAYEDMLRGIETIVQQAKAPAKDGIAMPRLAGIGLIERLLGEVRGVAKGLRQDRAVWYTREARLAIAQALPTELDERDKELVSKATRMAAKYKADYARATGFNDTFAGQHNATTAQSAIGGMDHNIEHWNGVPFQPLQALVWSPEWDQRKLYAAMHEVEQKFLERAKGSLALEEGDQIVIDFPPHDDVPRRAWVLLNRASCSKEATAMGHCGNSPRAHTEDRILSLRELEFNLEGVDMWRPCLTFILMKDGHLSEMKGRGNLKPAAHYHDEIEALLRNDIIKGLRGGGYLPQNNFAMSDMDEERRKRLASDKPELMNPRERYELFGLNDKMVETIRGTYEAEGYRGLMNYYKAIAIKDEDRDEMSRRYPDMRLPKEKYDAEGLTEGLMQEIANGVSKVAEAHEGHNGWTWFGNETYYTKDFTPYTMSDEDRRKLYTEVPASMDTAGEYWMHGLTERVIEDIKDEFERNGPKGAYDGHDLTFASMTDEDKDKLAEAGCAPFTYMLAKNGVDDTYMNALNEGIENWSYNLNREPEFKEVPGEEGKVFVLDEWDSPQEFIEAWGDKDFKNYASTEMEYYDPDVSDDAYHVENFDDIIGFQKTQVLRDYAEKLLRENEDDEDELEDKLSGLDSWSGIYEVLGEYESDITDAVKWAVGDGERTGSEDDMISTRESYLKRVNSDMEFGEIVYTMHGGEHIDNDGKVFMIMNPTEFSKYMDQVDSGFNLSFEELHKNGEIYFSAPQYGFQGFDETVACDSFCEDHQGVLPDEITDAFEGHTFGNPNNVPDDKGKKKLIADLYEKMGRTYGDIDALEGEKLMDVFKKTLVYYYGH